MVEQGEDGDGKKSEYRLENQRNHVKERSEHRLSKNTLGNQSYAADATRNMNMHEHHRLSC